MSIDPDAEITEIVNRLKQADGYLNCKRINNTQD
jgi:hypothetical protein